MHWDNKWGLDNYKIEFTKDGETDEKQFKTGEVHFHEGGTHSIKNTGTSKADFVVFERREGSLPEAANKGLDKNLIDAAAENAKELLNNNDFQVVEVNLPNNGKLSAHYGVSRVIYSLAPYKVKFGLNGGETEEREFKENEVHFHEPAVHTIENVGKTPAKFLIVELKK